MRRPSPQQGPLCPLGPWMAAKWQPSPAAPCLTRSTAWTLQNCTKQGTGEGGRQRAGEAQRGDVVPGDELGAPPPPSTTGCSLGAPLARAPALGSMPRRPTFSGSVLEAAFLASDFDRVP